MDGGAVGNHAQIMYKSGNNRLLLDPTTGVVAAITFNKLMSGQPVPEEQVRVFGSRPKPSTLSATESIARSSAADICLPI